MAGLGTQFDFRVDGKVGGELLIVPLLTQPKPALELLAPVDALCDDVASELVRSGALRDELGSAAHGVTRGTIRRVLLVSLGAREQAGAPRIRQAAAKCAGWLIEAGVEKGVLWMDGLMATGVERATSHWCAGLTQGGFAYEELKKASEGRPAKILVSVRGGDMAYARGKLESIRRQAALAEAVNTARRLGHAPANVLYPLALAEEARKLAARHKLKFSMLGMPELKKRKMNGLISVGRGAENKPCMIRLDYRGGRRNHRPTVLIGKAVTFDTGGYSLKDKAGLEALKFDKCGGAAVIGIMQAVAALGVRHNVIGLIPAAENAISAEAYRPGDIIEMMNGKTVEIISTDAEGRMILADALCYAEEECEPAEMIDLATLTGGASISLGKSAAALMSTDDRLASDLEESGRSSGERVWRLPLWDEYAELIRGRDSDLRNSSSKREAHAIVGGMFLKEFTSGRVPWAHLDIAATATDDNGAATGFGVRLVVEYLERFAG